MTPTEVGARVGKAVAAGIRCDGLDSPWPGLDVLDPDIGNPLGAAGIEPGTPAWREAEAAAEQAFREVMTEDW